jgi:hypothetical protein
MCHLWPNHVLTYEPVCIRVVLLCVFIHEWHEGLCFWSQFMSGWMFMYHRSKFMSAWRSMYHRSQFMSALRSLYQRSQFMSAWRSLYHQSKFMSVWRSIYVPQVTIHISAKVYVPLVTTHINVKVHLNFTFTFGLNLCKWRYTYLSYDWSKFNVIKKMSICTSAHYSCQYKS